MVRDIQGLLSEEPLHTPTDDSEAMVNGVLFVLCTAAVILTGAVLMLHAAA